MPGLSFAHCVAFAALLSAIDPVATLAVFKQMGPAVPEGVRTILLGESIVNDAAAIVIYRAALDFAGHSDKGRCGGVEKAVTTHT